MRSTILTFFLLASAFSISGCADLDPCKRGTEGCACRLDEDVSLSNPACDGALICAKDTCIAQPAATDAIVCYDACLYRRDGVCDDGGPGTNDPANPYCGIGSDCTDCGVRPNPCAGTASPVFCPQTPNHCWPESTSCLTVRRCGVETTPFGCAAGQAVDCSLGGANRCIAMACVNPALAPCIGEGACVAPFIDCNSLTTCNGQTVGCYSGETVVCSPSGSSCEL